MERAVSTAEKVGWLMIFEIEVFALFMGFDATIRVTYEITHWGAPAVFDPIYGGEPAEAPEWEVIDIGVTLDLDNGKGAEWTPYWREQAFSALANSRRVEDAIFDDIARIDRPRSRSRRYWDDAA